MGDWAQGWRTFIRKLRRLHEAQLEDIHLRGDRCWKGDGRVEVDLVWGGKPSNHAPVAAADDAMSIAHVCDRDRESRT